MCLKKSLGPHQIPLQAEPQVQALFPFQLTEYPPGPVSKNLIFQTFWMVTAEGNGNPKKDRSTLALQGETPMGSVCLAISSLSWGGQEATRLQAPTGLNEGWCSSRKKEQVGMSVNRNGDMLEMESTQILYSKTFCITIALLSGHTQILISSNSLTLTSHVRCFTASLSAIFSLFF